MMNGGGLAYIGLIHETGAVYDGAVNIILGVRPVVSLKNGILVNANGDGTTTNPYVVE